ncbi:SH2 domain-containing adapter protein F [Varanus komodoensis]|uniref:SH2 domain-containing adapter protein F n=1 Tax=Varanus komodoensis TaxID=61221 RepID=UPI001CF7C6AF|nr:SH2 domain-containing adapter protein F [Varanus komodoensis]
MVLDDYADPFDTTQEASGQTGELEREKSEGYIEPYEAQRLLAEIQKKGSKEGPPPAATPLHLYDDVPYEAPGEGAEPEGCCPPGARCRYSWLPEDDERPSEEYDQPWEWKKERISRVFAVEIAGIKDLPWPPPVGQLESSAGRGDAEGPLALQGSGVRGLPANSPPSLRNSSAGPPDATAPSSPPEAGGMEAADLQLPSCPEKSGSPCWLSVEHGLAFGERVNPSLPLESQAWYHGRLSRVGAEGLLRLCREASYLVRNSESTRDAFSLSLRSSQGFLHMQLLRTEDHKFVLGQHSPPFDNVPQVIHHYAKHRLPIQGAEHMTLLYPVATQPSPCLVAEQ